MKPKGDVIVLAVPYPAIDRVLGYMLKMGPEIGFKLLHG